MPEGDFRMDTIGLLGSVFTRHWLAPEALALWTDRATVQAWCEVEIALAKAQAELGLIPPAAAARIAAAARAEAIDMDQVAKDTAISLHPFVPVLKQLEVLCGEPAAGYLHWGATTQNIFDTASALQLKRSHEMLMRYLDPVIETMAHLAEEFAATPQAGRSHGQHALPITFGFKVAGWLAEIDRHRTRLRDAEDRAFAAVMGGAVGVYAAMDGRGREVQMRVADILGLADGGVATRATYDRAAEYVLLLGQLASSIERVARDIVFLQRTEIGEVAEAFHHGKIGSSTMAQKRNPSMALNLIGMATLLRGRCQSVMEIMVRMDEGDAALANAGDVLVPEMAVLAVSLAQGFSHLLGGLTVFPEEMQRNLCRTDGLIVTEAINMALAGRIGRHRAHELLYEAAIEAHDKNLPLRTILEKHPEIIAQNLDLESLFDPRNYTGEAEAVARQTAQATKPNSLRAKAAE